MVAPRVTIAPAMTSMSASFDSLADGGPDVATVAALADADTRRDALAELGDMADDANDPGTFASTFEGVHNLAEGVFAEGAEPLVDE
jgi:hypothetical protein